jgi:hypothetical protein
MSVTVKFSNLGSIQSNMDFSRAIIRIMSENSIPHSWLNESPLLVRFAEEIIAEKEIPNFLKI